MASSPYWSDEEKRRREQGGLKRLPNQYAGMETTPADAGLGRRGAVPPVNARPRPMPESITTAQRGLSRAGEFVADNAAMPYARAMSGQHITDAVRQIDGEALATNTLARVAGHAAPVAAAFRDTGLIGAAYAAPGAALDALTNETVNRGGDVLRALSGSGLGRVIGGNALAGERGAPNAADTADTPTGRVTVGPITHGPGPDTPTGRVTVGPITRGLDPGTRAPAPGLHRVVKTAPGVYTDDPNAQGQVRYYDAIGNRADASGEMPAGIRNETEFAAHQDANQFDLRAPGVQTGMRERGAKSLAQAERMGTEGAVRNAELQRRVMPAAQRAQLDEAEIAAGARDRQTMGALQAAQIEAAGRQSAAQTEAQARAAEKLLDHDQWAREFAANPETARAAMQQELGAFENFSPAERRSLLTDQTNPQASRLRAAVRGQLAAATGNRNVTPAQIKESGGLRRFITGHKFHDDSGWFGNGFNPGEFGMSDEQFLDFVFADRDARERW